jgi:hypothetical protein
LGGAPVKKGRRLRLQKSFKRVKDRGGLYGGDVGSYRLAVSIGTVAEMPASAIDHFWVDRYHVIDPGLEVFGKPHVVDSIRNDYGRLAEGCTHVGCHGVIGDHGLRICHPMKEFWQRNLPGNTIRASALLNNARHFTLGFALSCKTNPAGIVLAVKRYEFDPSLDRPALASRAGSDEANDVRVVYGVTILRSSSRNIGFRKPTRRIQH